MTIDPTNQGTKNFLKFLRENSVEIEETKEEKLFLVSRRQWVCPRKHKKNSLKKKNERTKKGETKRKTKKGLCVS